LTRAGGVCYGYAHTYKIQPRTIKRADRIWERNSDEGYREVSMAQHALNEALDRM